MRGLQLAQLVHQRVVLGIAYRWLVEDVVLVVVALDELPQLRDPLLDVHVVHTLPTPSRRTRCPSAVVAYSPMIRREYSTACSYTCSEVYSQRAVTDSHREDFMAAGSEARDDPYAGLRQRAYLFLRERDGAVPEEELIEHVFGSSGNPALWRPLLRQVLGADDRLDLRADGYWALRGTAPVSRGLLPTDFVVIDIETTGLRPLRQRIIEVAAIRYRGGRRQDVFSTLVNPERPVPAYIRKLTGIDETALAGAPEFRRVADELTAFLGDDLLIGYNVEFDIAFLNAELKRLGRPPLINPRLDLLPLSTQLIPGMRRSG